MTIWSVAGWANGAPSPVVITTPVPSPPPQVATGMPACFAAARPAPSEEVGNTRSKIIPAFFEVKLRIAEFAWSALPAASTVSTVQPAAFAASVTLAMTRALLASVAVIVTIPTSLLPLPPAGGPPALSDGTVHAVRPSVSRAAAARTTLFQGIADSFTSLRGWRRPSPRGCARATAG